MEIKELRTGQEIEVLTSNLKQIEAERDYLQKSNEEMKVKCEKADLMVKDM